MTDDEITEARDRVRSHRDKAVKLTALMAYANKTAEGAKEMGDDAGLADDASMLAQRIGVRIDAARAEADNTLAVIDEALASDAV